VFTIEPGVYIPGKFGVRIEDNVMIEKGATTNITQLTHELVEL
jgi:Xaa-Pro aminopeptidase